ncbi:MAG TPA: bifunctional 23S rRNA (guanine(2069)-N(7))-methyltransferase RlmK/23S rRNA (guanine(2445)-N(2))-methyltransferase RlmL [Coriobacteriia bacterium]|nr:bifunctional 23S rRNA (guanine(2069)-N(7))-methyltransferase RlmK/23S rRNA (guanine(2445)-N(2))-methyltransferase RlmL [Coriobacteriia bacterium]
MSDARRYFAPCPAGIESLLADELRALGLRGVRPQRSGVLFTGRTADGLKALFWTRLASRVLLTLAEVDASSADALYDAVKELPWEEHLRAGGTIAVDASGVNDELRNTQFTAVKVKDAIADRFREKFGRRPSVDVSSPDVRVNVALRATKATISIDLAGEPLHRRGYRTPGVQVAAPMKETLAAAVVALAGWPKVAAAGGAFVDPMCGSGTLAIEAALAAADIAPGLLNPRRSVERWLGFDRGAWDRLIDQAHERREAGLAKLPPILASDGDPKAIEIARTCIRRAGLEGRITLELRELASFDLPKGGAPGLVCTNPPWGERLSERSELPALYDVLAARLRGAEGWRLAVVSPDPDLAEGLHLAQKRTVSVGSGKGVATVTMFEIGAKAVAVKSEPKRRERNDRDRGASAAPARKAPADLPAVDATDFVNRLGKMSKHLGKWARKAGVGCYRVYDADLPEFALAIDMYAGDGPDEGKRWVYVAEYAAPGHIDEDKAAARLEAAVAAIPEVLGVPAEAVFVKRRERQRGSAQYDKLSACHVTGVVSESGLLFEVNFTDYLDTGLFLDHRDTRGWLGELASGKRFLNLFAYTGTATVHAAAGKAANTTTVDLSATYVSWARRNLALNGIADTKHEFVQADTITWLEQAAAEGREFDLVFCDPPTFSNSKRMDGTWDVQRDHAGLLLAIERVLAPGGQIVFSNNRRSFKLDADALAGAGLVATDVTGRTIPKDFERRPNVHNCWSIERG